MYAVRHVGPESREAFCGWRPRGRAQRLSGSRWHSRWLLPSLAAAVILCATAGLACQPKQELNLQTIVVASSPESGAEVRVNGEVLGETPHKIEGLRPGQRIIVELAKEGYKPTWQTVEITESEEESRVIIELERLVGYLTVNSIPSGAEVWLDDVEYLGRTPLQEHPVLVGEHYYTIRSEDYAALQRGLTVEKDFRYTFTHKLEQKPAVLRVYSRPTGGTIWLNFVEQEQTTPAEFYLNAGEYTVAVHAQGYIMAEKTVALDVNDDLKVMLSMEEGDAPPGMLLVPAGEFIFGVDRGPADERPQRVIDLPAFYIDKYEVTNADFVKVFPEHAVEPGREYFPVTGVTWDQAAAYAETVGKRLPTEREWEKAARGTDGREYPWGNVFDAKMCNSSERPNPHLMVAGGNRAGSSPYGCLDMAGNAYEWTADWYQAYPGNTDIIKEYGQLFRVLRGGSYKSRSFDVRTTRRLYDRQDSAGEDYGFRCAKDVVN